MTFAELRKAVEEVDVGYPLADTVTALYDLVNEVGGGIGEYDFDDFIDINTAEELARHELDSGGLPRLYYFMGDVNLAYEDIVRVNGYGNLEEVSIADVELLKETLLEQIDDAMENEEEW